MKKTFLKVLAVFAFATAFTVTARADGDIYDILPCNQDGVVTYPSSTPDSPMTSGDYAYFIVRFLQPELSCANKWAFEYIGSSPIGELLIPRIGIFVSGVCTYADFDGYVYNSNAGITDLKFKYKVQSGDFALPIKLALNSSDGPIPASEKRTKNTSAYYVDPSRYSMYGTLSGWRLQCTLNDGTVKDAVWTAVSDIASRKPSPVPGREEFWNLSKFDESINNYRGFYAKTIDFSSKWHTPKTIWRTVHMGSPNCDRTPQLEPLVPITKKATFYVWSTNENVVVLRGDNVTGIPMPDPLNPSVKKTFQVAAITFDEGQSDAKDFAIYGQSDTVNGGWGGLVLSATNTFTISDSTMDIIDDFVVVPVRCIEKLPPSVLIESDRTTVTANSNYKTGVTRLTIKLSQTIATSFKVKITPKLSDGTDISSSWGDYVRFSTDQVVDTLPDAVIPEITLGGGVMEASLYVFALRGDAHTVGVNQLQFKTSADSRPSEIEEENFGMCGINVIAQNPVIEEPAEGSTLDAVQFDDTPVTIRVSDTYADMSSTIGYKIYVKYHPSDTEHASEAPAGFKRIDGLYKPGNGGILERCDDGSKNLPVFKYDATGEYITKLYVVAPVSGNSSCGTSAIYREINSIVTPTKSVSVTTDAKTEEGEPKTEFNEGDQPGIKISLSEPTKNDLYAYLKITSDDVAASQFSSTTPFVIGMTNTSGKCRGLKIARGKSEASAIKLKLLDGYGPATGDYLSCDFEVVLSTSSEYLCSSKSDLPPNIVSGYESGSLTLVVRNVEPTIKYVELNGAQSQGDGYEFSFKLPKGQAQNLKAKISDPSSYDLKNDFACRWEIWVKNADGKYEQKDAVEKIGNPDTDPATYEFPYQGMTMLILKVKDKDMDDWSTKTYTSYVEVLANPGVSVEPSSEYVLETDTKSYINFGLSYYDATIPLYVKITVEPAKASTAAKHGELLLDPAYKTSPDPTKYPEADNVYYLTFNSSAKQKIVIERMDGTDISDIYGFLVKAEVVNEEANPKTGIKWKDYYIANLSTKVHPQNVAPNGGNEDKTFAPTSNSTTNRWESSRLLNWSVRTDAYGDLDNPDNQGIKIKIEGCGGDTYNLDGFVNGVKYVHEATSGTFSPDLSLIQGEQEVSITISDKDGGELTRTWYFKTAESKFLNTRAHGPNGGNSTDSDISQKYSSASGIGAGHVWSDGGFVAATDFILRWNCLKATTKSLYAWGYKTAKPEDDGTLDTHDIAIDKNGSAPRGGATSNFYTYSDEFGRDSFFYAWLMTATDGEDGTAMTKSIAPERTKTGAQVGRVTLAAEANEDGGYPETDVEAVFSKEYYVADNMGDINQDRIPDLYYSKYGFTTTSTSLDTRSGMATTEEVDVSDLESLTGYNEDGDFLPGLLDAQYTAFTTNANGLAFTAVWEIRGFGDGMNNAASLAGVNGVESDLNYTDPDQDGSASADIRKGSTLTKVEYLAWLEYKAAHPSATEKDWSPERPTDPTMADTDSDGFTDGFEYYFWYRAHVGYINANGQHERMTGRRFDVRNPGTGTLITSEAIEEAMDPIVAANVDAITQDTDNDGLPDLIEFYLGTNPFDFDTDGDGLPDGWEIMVSCTDPLLAYTETNQFDGLRNNDGDAMAITSPKQELAVLPVIPPASIQQLMSFAVIDKDGDSDGVQWYVIRPEDEATALAYTPTTKTGTKVMVNGVAYITTVAATSIEYKGNPCLAVSLTKDNTFALTNATIGGQDYTNIRTTPTFIPAGTVLDADPVADESYTELSLSTVPEASSNYCNAAWVYGADVNKDGKYGFLALSRYQVPAKDMVLAEIPSVDREVCYLHYLVYQQFGFDPRTAWSPKSPLSARWNTSDAGDGAYADQTIKSQGGYTQYSTRTRAYAAYDEFLVMSFFANNGTLANEKDFAISSANPWTSIWNRYTTNPRGAGETGAVVASYDETSSSVVIGSQILNDNGADTDLDGVPDGWELYVMSGPKKKGIYVFASPYVGFATAASVVVPEESYCSPFVAKAQHTDTDSESYGFDFDKLTEQREFAGTDTIAYYSSICSNMTAEVTIVRPEADAKWLNKFFPTDPWTKDTDGDGVSDADEGKAFVYGTPADNSKLWSIPGGGLNPCSVDTDLDGLPDGWEKQFTGKTIYSGDSAHYAAGLNDDKKGNPLEGYIDGMDGTVVDSYTVPSTITVTEADGRMWIGSVNRDYDHDGLENWQEYLVGTMRCWRYDDPISSWTYIPYEKYYFDVEGVDTKMFVAAKAAAALGYGDNVNKFWYDTLVDKESKIYNPYLVTDRSSGAMYFSPVTNGWDVAFKDAALDKKLPVAAYYFYHRIGDALIENLWASRFGDDLLAGINKAPTKYISCSPIDPDTDCDGMDDYYELFHGMNPLLGDSGEIYNGTPYDVVFDAWYSSADSMTALKNVWRSEAEKYDFIKYPWLNGMTSSDPDGDDIRNQEEAIMPKLATATWHHTDPTPLWMTDSTYTNSLTRMFWRMPVRDDYVLTGGDSFTYNNVTYRFDTFPGFIKVSTGMLGEMPALAPFAPDYWKLYSAGYNNWMFSFEENEGFDSDHDGISDQEELQGKFGSASNPQNADSPRRRQAMYFQGSARPSLLQTMPYRYEQHPLATVAYPDEMAFLQYTVECWAYPESLDDSTLIERVSRVSPSNVGDEEYIRCNFQIAIKDGKWYTKFDSRGTLASNQVEVVSANAARANTWTHLAATFDGKALTFYVNGKAETVVYSSLQPEYGSQSVNTTVGGDYVGDNELALTALIVGASAKTQQEYQQEHGKEDNTFGLQLNVSYGLGFKYYKNFYKGYIDEVRVWDGARSSEEIKAAMYTRADADFIKNNRAEFVTKWINGERRYAKNSSGVDYEVPAELRYHYSFDSIFAADNEAQVAKEPHGFGDTGDKAPASRPTDYSISWWKRVLQGYNDTVYNSGRWITWVPNTVAHMPRYDGTTQDSLYWSEDFQGAENGVYKFAREAEPITMWSQLYLAGVTKSGWYITTGSRHHLVNGITNANHNVLFEYTGRNRSTLGDDMLALGGAYVKYCDNTVNMWDDQGASCNWEITGSDSDNDGLPDWWEVFAKKYGDNLSWSTMVRYPDADGVMIKAGEAYLRDLARGYYANASGVAVADDATYRQVYDEDKNGLPDWWERLYNLNGVSALADSDNDGLSNYLEYMLSEVFKFKNVRFNPIKANSTDEYTPDYFFKVGSLYVGEIFTDHDLVDDTWEDQYETTFASRLKYDAFNDADEDGWSNRSENRYSKLCRPLVASKQFHYTVADNLVADYPIPAVALKVRYNGARQDTVRTAPLVVKFTTDYTYMKDADATYYISEVVSEDTTSTSDTTDTNDKYIYNSLGSWSERHAIGTLTPGNIKQGELFLQYVADPSVQTYRWYVQYGAGHSDIYSGSREDYDAAKLKYGDEAVLVDKVVAYQDCSLDSKTSETSEELTWYLPNGGKRLGTINLVTGAYDLDFSALKGVKISSSSNSTSEVSMEDQTFRLKYQTYQSVGLPRDLYLGNAEGGSDQKSGNVRKVGHVREGKNIIMAWADLDGGTADKWDPGEPFGIVKDVDISWRGTSAELELTDTHTVFDRLDLAATGDASSSRQVIFGSEGGTSDAPSVRTNSLTNVSVGELSGGVVNHIRVVPYLVRGTKQEAQLAPEGRADLFVYAYTTNRVVAEFDINSENISFVHEGFFLNDDTFDIDWKSFRKELRLNSQIVAAVGDVTAVTYRLILGGEGPIGPLSASDNITVVNAFPTVIERRFESVANRTQPTAVAPGAQIEETVIDAAPTFKWRLDEPSTGSGKFGCSYPAFRIIVCDANSNEVYNSGIQRTPPKDADGNFVWKASLYVNDLTTKGNYFANKAMYTWKVSMYNAKFREDLYSEAGRFFVNVQTNGYSYGSANVAVRYFGPAESYEGKTIRVRAYTSPDFSGMPVAAGCVKEPSGLAQTGVEPAANCEIIGIPTGTYYLQAWIDSNSNGLCDPWESSGYYCTRDGSAVDYLNPVGVVYGSAVGNSSTLTIYLEDADTDGDGLPDAWEYAIYGGLNVKGVELVKETAAGERLVNHDLSGAVLDEINKNAVASAGVAGIAQTFLSNAGTLALALGVNPVGYGSFTSAITGEVSDELADDGVSITSLEMVNGKISIKVSAETQSSVSSPMSSVLAGNSVVSAKCYVSYTDDLCAGWSDWQYVQDVSVGAADAETIDISTIVPVGTNSCYIKVKLEK